MAALSFLQLSLLLVFLLHLHSTAFSADLSTDMAALLAFRSAVGGLTLFWNTTATTPCNWRGVFCENNRVVVLRLNGASLSGTLPAYCLSHLTALRTLSLCFNNISDPLPEDLPLMVKLRNLYLHGNNFSGHVPDFLFYIEALERLNLGSNKFFGEISSGFNKLTRLQTLLLENNQFSGRLPDIKLPNLNWFNVSFNNLNGCVPKRLEGMPKDSFLGTSLCGKPLDVACAGGTLCPYPSEAARAIEIPKNNISDLSIDMAGLLAFRSAVGGRTLFWDTTAATPCNWRGVFCEYDRVVHLSLIGASLSGTIPADSLSHLTALRTLTLNFNNLSGPLPGDLSRLTQLKNLSLYRNHFSGHLPGFLFDLQSLERLNLAYNNFSGEISSEFNNLTRLQVLLLMNNQFSGRLPDIKLPNLSWFDVSFNNLSAKGLEGMQKDFFLGNSLCGKPLDSVCIEAAKRVEIPMNGEESLALLPECFFMCS